MENKLKIKLKNQNVLILSVGSLWPFSFLSRTPQELAQAFFFKSGRKFHKETKEKTLLKSNLK